MSFNKQNLSEIKSEIALALKAVEKKHGVIFELGRISYSDSDFRMSVKCHSNSNGADSPLELEWMKHCKRYGFKNTDLMKKVNLGGEVHEILGLKTRNRKYPVITKRVRDSKQYKWTERRVQDALKERAASTF